MYGRTMSLARKTRVLVAIVALGCTSLMSGCAVLGAGIGALTGQALGGNTRSTVAGATLGAVIGAQVDAAYVRSAAYHGHETYTGYIVSDHYCR